MNQPLQAASRGPQSVPRLWRAAHRKSRAPKRLLFHVSILILLAVLSTAAGYQAARLEIPGSRWFHLSTALASAPTQSPALVAASNASAAVADVEAIGRLAPQQQAERLLELAVRLPDQSLGLIHKNLDSWRGHLEDTDQLFHLVLAALDSNDPRVRVAAVEIDLVANNLMKSPQSLAKLLNQIHNDPDGRYLALWRLGALGNRGVEPATVLSTLLRYSRDSNQRTRFWAVEGLAMLGTAESIDPLLTILAHDPAKQIRERAASCLARSGMLTGEQRLTAVPQLLNLLDDDSLDPGTLDLVYASLTTITGASFGRNAAAWREWWAHHDQPEKRVHGPRGLLLA
jgi:HEAT repeats